jgi:pimeloyl-ACP methyl ester carboxylesterase
MGRFFKHHQLSLGDYCLSMGESPAVSNGKSQDTIFFLHGRFCGGQHWQPVIELLCDRYQCFTPDLPGFGKSYSRQGRVLSFIEHARVVRYLIESFAPPGRRVFLVGHDIGGAIALICTVNDIHSPLISGLSLLNCTDPAGSPHGLVWASLLPRLRFWYSLQKSRRLSAEHRQELWGFCRKRGLGALLKGLSWPDPGEREYWRGELSKIKIPVLLLRGSLDRVNPREMGLDLIRAMPDALYFEEESSGHWPFLENPEWVAPKLQEFFFHTKAA